MCIFAMLKPSPPVCVRYPCRWAGVVEGKPMVAGLEEFGARALNNLWNAIQKKYPDEVGVRIHFIIK